MMRSGVRQRCIQATVLLMMVGLLPLSASAPPTGNPDDSGLLLASDSETSGTGLWLVRLAEPSLSAYRGGIAGLAPTSPRVTGAAELDVAAPASVAYLDYLAGRQDEATDRMERLLGRPMEVGFRYLNVFNGMAVRADAAEAARLATLPGVAEVYPDTVRQLDTDVSHELIGSAAIWEGRTASGVGTSGEGVIVGMLDTGVNPDHPSFAEVGGDGHVHTNPYGSGNFVGVCDPEHPEHEAICNDKLIGAWNFHPSAPDAQDRNGHGSHTGSTMAGNRHEATITVGQTQFTRTVQGVAPHANIISYLVCSPRCLTSSSVAAVDQAVADGVEVLNYSISGSNDPWQDPVDLAFLDAFNAGIFVAASAGNDGPGAGTVAHAGPWNASVAASTHHRVFAHTLEVTGPAPVPGGLQAVAAVPGEDRAPTATIQAPVRDAGLVAEGNLTGCTSFPDAAFTGAVALIRRGDCNFAVKVNNAAAAGAVAVVVFNNVAGPPISMGGLETTTRPSVFVDQDSGEALRGYVADHDPDAVEVSIGPDSALVLDDGWADTLAGFSSRGPSGIDTLAPSLTAPGVNILAAGAAEGGDPDQYLLLQGTSMAAPHAAGAAALLTAVHPAWSPARLRSAMAGTADPSVTAEDGQTPATPLQQGTGRIDLDRAGRVGVVLDETHAGFVAADPATGGDPKTLNLPGMVNAACVEVCGWTRTLTSVAEVDATYTATVQAPEGMQVTVTPDQFTLPAAGAQQIEVTVETTGMPEDEWAFASVGFETGATHPASGEPVAPVSYPVAVTPVTAAGHIDVDPRELTSTQEPDQVTTHQLTIGNTGNADLSWHVLEDTGSAATARLPRAGTTPVTTAPAARTDAGPAGTAAGATLARRPGAGEGNGAVAVPPPAPAQEGTVVLTHSESHSIRAANSAACSPDGGATTTDNAYLRTFTLADFGVAGDFQVSQVSFGVEHVGGIAQTLAVNLYALDPGDPFVYANLSLLGSTQTTLEPQSLTSVTVPVTGTAPAGSTLVVEVAAPDMSGTGSFFIGSNNAGQSAPSYLSSVGCGHPEPVNVAALGAPGMHVVMSVTGSTQALSCEAPAGTTWAALDSTSGTVSPGGTQQVTVSLDSTGLQHGDVLSANLCLASDDPDRPVVVVPLTLEVHIPQIPAVTVTPPQLSTTLAPGQVTEQTLTIGNPGTSTLEWTVHAAGPGDGATTIAPAATRARATESTVTGPGVTEARLPEAGVTEAGVLHDNGPLVTHPGDGPEGSDWSMLQSGLEMSSFGFSASQEDGFRVADDLTVTDPGGWNVDTLTFYAYQTGSPTTSTLTHVNYRIWDGPPEAEGSSVVFGDTTTNRLLETDWTGAYRVSEITIDTVRPIMNVVADGGFHLPAGSYWIDWQLDGLFPSGPWQPPVTITGQATTGNGLQRHPISGQWDQALDSGSATPQALPFTLTGTLAEPHPCDIPNAPAWLDVAPASGTTPAGGTSQVTVTLDATDLAAGEHRAQLCVTSNAPDRPRVTVPVALTVQDTGGEPSQHSQDIVATVPQPGHGSLVVSVDPDDRVVELPPLELAATADRLASTGQLRPVTVTDTRTATNPGWDTTAQIGDFTSGDASFGGGFLGWVPHVVSQSQGQTVTPGAEVAPGFPSGDGLAVPQRLANAAPDAGTGVAVLDAQLTLHLPTDTPTGTYTAMLTLTTI